MFPLNVPQKLDLYLEEDITQYVVDELMNERLFLRHIVFKILFHSKLI